MADEPPVTCRSIKVATVRNVLSTVPRRNAGILFMLRADTVNPSASAPFAKRGSGGAASMCNLLQSASSSSAAICGNDVKIPVPMSQWGMTIVTVSSLAILIQLLMKRSPALAASLSVRARRSLGQTA